MVKYNFHVEEPFKIHADESYSECYPDLCATDTWCGENRVDIFLKIKV
jgi:hypothetical protein